jgi:hypothetical protein
MCAILRIYLHCFLIRNIASEFRKSARDTVAKLTMHPYRFRAFLDTC